MTFTYGVNYKIIGKTSPDKLSYPGAFVRKQGGMADLAKDIGVGRPWIPAQLDEGKPRQQQYANYAELLGADFDSGMTIAKAIEHPFIAKYCGLGIESANSKVYDAKKNPDSHEKFRAVFRLAKPVIGWRNVRTCYRYLIHLLGVADPACKDAHRFFFGAPGKTPFILNESACLPESFVDDAIAWHQEILLEAQRRAEIERRQWEKWRRHDPESDNEIEEALSYVDPYKPGEERYSSLIAMIGAVLSTFGESEGSAILNRWDAGRGQWGRGGFDRILRSVARSQTDRKATLGTLFYLAKQGGYRPKVKPKSDFKLPDITEPDPIEYGEWCEWEERQKEIEAAQQRFEAWVNSKGNLAKLSRKLKPAKGFTVQPQTQDEAFEYEEGGRVATWRSLVAHGDKFILDQSGTGSGKSFDTGNLKPEDFEAKQIFYITDQPRNPTNATLSEDNGWVVVEGRHGGLKVDDSGKLRVAKPGDEIVVPGNCIRTDAIGALRAKNVYGADTDVACLTCPRLNACKHFAGDGHGWISKRKLNLPRPKVRIHPTSSPEPANYDYLEVVAIVDEPDQILATSKTIEVSDRDIDQTAATLALKNPELLCKVQPFLVGLKALMGQKARYGVKLSDIRQALPALTSFDYEDLWAALQPDLSVLEAPDEVVYDLNLDDIEAEYKRDRADLDRQHKHDVSSLVVSKADKDRLRAEYKEQKAALKAARDRQVKQRRAEYRAEYKDINRVVRRATSQSSNEAQRQIEEKVLKQWLPEFLEILQSDRGGAAHIHYGKLILTLPDNRLSNTLKQTKATIFLDATLTREDLALKLGCDPSEIKVVRQKQPDAPNLKLTQIYDLGRMGMQRGDEQQRRSEVLVTHYKQVHPGAKVIDFKKFEADGAWWRDSRGVNDFLNCETLILVGTPCQNLNAILAEYTVLTGVSDLEDEGFKAYVDRKIRADIHQAIGRLRAHRRLDEQLQVILITDFDLGLPNVEQVKASSITVEAAGKLERFKQIASNAIARLREAGEKVTQTAVSAITGYSQQYLSRHWKLLLLLLDDLYSKSSRKSDPPPDMVQEPEIEAVAIALEACTLELSPLELSESVEDLFFQTLNPKNWGALLERLSDHSKFAVLESLLPLVPLQELEEIAS